MIPFGNETVTLIQRIELLVNEKKQVKYTRHIISGCSWKMSNQWSHVGAEMQRRTEVTCRIPHGNVTPVPGDYLFFGYIKDKITDTASLSEALAKNRANGAMRVASVSNNSLVGFPMPHVTARGDSA